MDISEDRQTHELIDELLKRKNPALVGIRKILRAKSDSVSSTRSFSAHTPEVFGIETEEKSRENETIFTDKEITVLEAEKRILELEEVIKQKDEEIKAAAAKSYEEGKVDGVAESQEKTKAVIAEIEEKIKEESQARLTAQINSELEDRLKHFKSLEEEIYQIIVLIVKKVLAIEITSNSYLIVNIIKQSLAHVSQRDGITIRVSNDDYEYVIESVSQFNRHNDGTYSINIVPDEHIKTGGCLVETNSTIVDAQAEKRTEKIIELLERVWNESKDEEA
jgi:flagellar assembly protein FliH